MGKEKRRQQNLVQGSLILAVATLLVKVLGAIYKIPLANILGGLGGGYYSTAYDIYLPVYSLAMAGLPVAVSRMVAESAAKKNYRNTRKILKIAQRAFLITGTVGTVAILALTYFYLFSDGFRSTFGITSGADNVYSIMLISFSILFCCIMSSYRGYYEGLRNMYPTAVSQVIEAVGKLIVGLVLAGGIKYVCVNQLGMTADQAAPFAAGGAVLGVTLGSAVGAIYLIIRHRRAGDGITDEELELSPPADSTKDLLKMLIVIAIPIVIGSLVRDIASLVDLTTVKARLATVVGANPDLIKDCFGVSVEYDDIDKTVTYLYGCYKTFAYSLYNLVPTITAVIGVSTIPTLCTAWASKDTLSVEESIHSILKLTAVISLPAGIGITALSGPILSLLFSDQPNEVIISTPILMVLGIAAIFSGIAVPTTSMLQAIGKQNVPVINMAVGVLLKIVVNYTLVGIEGINVVGAPAGTGVCYAYIMIANLVCLRYHSKAKFKLVSTVVKPLVCALLCGATAYFGYELLSSVGMAGKLGTAICIILACAVYAICLGVTKTFTKNDILMLPKGDKLVKILAKMRWIG